MVDIFPGSERRRSKRRRVLRSGKIILGNPEIAIDCIIWDELARGLLATTNVDFAVPKQVKIEIRDSAVTLCANRRWVSGNFIGFGFIDDRPHVPATFASMREIREVLQPQRIFQAIHRLRSAGFLENSQLNSAAEEVEIAVARLESLLSGGQIGQDM